MERRHLSRLERACLVSQLSMTEGCWRYSIVRSDPYGSWTTYRREPARPGESEDELLEILAA